MRIPKDTWEKYIAYLHKMSDEAATKMAAFLETVDINAKEGLRAALNYGFQLSNAYGAGTSEMACQMYDRAAEASGKHLPLAETAELPTYKDVAKTIQGKMRDSKDVKVIGASIGRLVKRTGVDTTMMNAIRDGAEWAWVPHGDSCGFCLALGANGWQKASKKALKDGHARHIHENCDCTYAIRFDDKSSIEGYYPSALKRIYEMAEGGTWNDKVKSINRKNRELEKEINNVNKVVKDVSFEYLKNAKPKSGYLRKEKGFSDVNGEEQMAFWLHDEMFGGDILLLGDTNPDGEYNPDFLWNQKLWDLKTPRSSKESTIRKRIKHGLEQIKKNPGGVIIDISKSEKDIKSIENIIEMLVIKKGIEGVDFIIKDGEEFKALRV